MLEMGAQFKISKKCKRNCEEICQKCQGLSKTGFILEGFGKEAKDRKDF